MQCSAPSRDSHPSDGSHFFYTFTMCYDVISCHCSFWHATEEKCACADATLHTLRSGSCATNRAVCPHQVSMLAGKWQLLATWQALGREVQMQSQSGAFGQTGQCVTNPHLKASVLTKGAAAGIPCTTCTGPVTFCLKSRTCEASNTSHGHV